MAKPTSLLTSVENRNIPRLFVAATRQNDGKTTSCLGLFAALQQTYPRMGYIKPIGQRFIQHEEKMIDEDSYLFDRTFDTETPLDAMSPVAIDTHFTRRYLDDPGNIHPALVDTICRAFDRTAFHKDAVIIEGSGHAGVGAVCDLSNAQVAGLLNAKVVIVSRGGIGQPVDEIALNKALFDRYGIEVIGAILNKIELDKIETVRNYAGRALEKLDVPLLGLIPKTQELAYPNLSQVVDAVKGRWINGQKTGGFNRITQVIVGAMTAKSLVDYIKPGILVITPGDREDILLLAIAAAGVDQTRCPSGIILTRNILPTPHLMEMISQTEIPVAISRDESYAVASKIYSMTVKTQPEDADKIPIIKQLIHEYVNVDYIIKRMHS